MNEAHWHLVVNHLPIIFPIVGVIVMITGLISKSEAVKRTAFMIFVFGALAAIAAMNTGEGAEEVVENINGVSENFIESHEEAAETFAILSYILGGISLLGLWASFKQKSFSSIISIATLIFAFVVLFFARHTEIRSGNNIPASENKNAEEDQDD
jgi:uncharacterized membrane protein